MTDTPLSRRYAAARRIAAEAGAIALDHYRRRDELTVDRKGHQDLVSEADRRVEAEIRARLAAAFPEDGIIGEEAAPSTGTSGFTWVIDPIDGTTNFVNGIAQWCVILACVEGGRVVVGVVHDPVHDEMHHAAAGGGAFCNDRPARCAEARALAEGSFGVGYAGRRGREEVKRLVAGATDRGTVFWRNGSGGLSLAYVASGRILGYAEEHMNAWDFLAGHLIVAEAGGRVAPVDVTRALAEGARVVAAAPGVYDEVQELARAAYG